MDPLSGSQLIGGVLGDPAHASMEAWAGRLIEWSYEGWVAYMNDGSPIFEAVVGPSGAAHSLVTSFTGVVRREEDRQTKEWKSLPHEKIIRLELYLEPTLRTGARPNALCFRADREPGNHALRFLQMKEGGLILQSGSRHEAISSAPERLGRVAYRVGYWNPAAKEAILFRISRKAVELWGKCKDPWSDRPEGWGFNRQSFGL